MSRSRFSFALITSFAVAAAYWIIRIPERVVAFAVSCLDTLVLSTDARAIVDLFGRERSLAFEGPSGDQIDSALYQRNRHEAGLARLGAVRHR